MCRRFCNFLNWVIGCVLRSYVSTVLECKGLALQQNSPSYALGYDINSGIVCYLLPDVPDVRRAHTRVGFVPQEGDACLCMSRAHGFRARARQSKLAPALDHQSCLGHHQSMRACKHARVRACLQDFVDATSCDAPCGDVSEGSEALTCGSYATDFVDVLMAAGCGEPRSQPQQHQGCGRGGAGVDGFAGVSQHVWPSF